MTCQSDRVRKCESVCVFLFVCLFVCLFLVFFPRTFLFSWSILSTNQHFGLAVLMNDEVIFCLHLALAFDLAVILFLHCKLCATDNVFTLILKESQYLIFLELLGILMVILLFCVVNVVWECSTEQTCEYATF